MVQKNFPAGTQSSPFLQPHSFQLRIWHWLTFLFITASVVTVLLNSTLFSQRDNIKLVQDQLKGQGVTVTNDQAFAVSREYEDKLWGVHKLIGYGLVFLLLARVLIEFTQPEEEKLRNRLKKASVLSKQNNDHSEEYKHYLRVKGSYMVFFVFLFFLALTGLGLAFGREIGFSREIHEGLKNIHAFIQYLMYAFVLVHIGGVIVAENGKIRGIVSGMINGNRT